ncbi:glycosyltransferase family 2 protein [Candidatus Uhrbacteria bacterium]|nr:glycosyltransferase family 2 protein [Candidatus Uhrbacteria bacterium]
MSPNVAIISLTYHGKDSYTDITRCFRSLERLDYPRDAVEVICVENPSPHGASWPFIEREWMPRAGVTFPRLAIIKNDRDLGYSGANVVGVESAIAHGCAYAFLLNQDADIDTAFLRTAVACAEHDPTVGFVQSLLLLGNERDRVNSVGNRYHFLGHGYSGGYRWTMADARAFFASERKRNPDLEVPYFSGAAVLVRLAMVERIGLFDPAFYMYHEDVDATFNARMYGWKTVIEPASMVYHYYQFTKSIKKFYWMERNRFIVLLTYYRLPTLMLLALPFLTVELGSFLVSTRSGWWREKTRAWRFMLRSSTWRWIWQRRRRIQRERQISDRTLLRWAESRILFQEGDASGTLVTRIANPIMAVTWKMLYFLIRW